MPKIIDSISSYDLHGSLIPQGTMPLGNDLASMQIKPIAKAAPSSFKAKMNFLIEKIKQVASLILTVSISALLYWVNPSLFAIGFITGIIIDDHVRCAIQKIKDVWTNQKFTGTFIGGFACALSMPVTLAAASILWSANLGACMTKEAQRLLINSRPSSGEKPEMLPVV